MINVLYYFALSLLGIIMFHVLCKIGSAAIFSSFFYEKEKHLGRVMQVMNEVAKLNQEKVK